MKLSELIKKSESSEIVLNSTDVLQVEEECYEIPSGVHISGNGALIEGTGSNKMLIAGSDVTFDHIRFKKFNCVFHIDGKGDEVKNIRIEDCEFEDYEHYAVLTASTVSGSTIRNVNVSRCYFVGPTFFHDRNENACAGIYPFMVQIAMNTGKEELSDCHLENIRMDHCHCHGGNRVAFWFSGATSTDLPGGLEKGTYGHTTRLTAKHIVCEDNDFHDCFDATINWITAMYNQSETTADDVIIRNNVIEQGIWGIFVIAGEPLLDHINGIHLSNVLIEGNTIYQNRTGAGEDSHGICVQAGRVDYFDDCGCENCTTENVVIRNNNIRDVTAGMMILGCDSLTDGKGNLLSNCVTSNVQVIGNTISNVDIAYKFIGAWIEGRAFDYQIGVPPLDVTWVPFVENDRDRTVEARGNIVRNVVVKNNIVRGYKYKCIVSGTLAHGHAVVENNAVENIIFESNSYENGERHINVADEIIDDYVLGTGNRIDQDLKWRIN